MAHNDRELQKNLAEDFRTIAQRYAESLPPDAEFINLVADHILYDQPLIPGKSNVAAAAGRAVLDMLRE